jgi:hypothetical protein
MVALDVSNTVVPLNPCNVVAFGMKWYTIIPITINRPKTDTIFVVAFILSSAYKSYGSSIDGSAEDAKANEALEYIKRPVSNGRKIV